MCRQNRKKSSSFLKDRWQQVIHMGISRGTVNSRPLKQDLRARRTAKKPLLTHERKIHRLEWARRHQNRQLRHWRHVLFSDESRFLLHRADGRVHVRRREVERYHEDCVVGTVACGDGSVHVWGAIHYGGRSNLVILHNNVNGDSYRQLLVTEMVPCARPHFGRNFLLQHDNAPPHRARGVHDSLEGKEIDQLDWQLYSPDMNPI